MYLTSTTFGYDALGHTATAATNVFGFLAGFVYDYDSADHVVGITYPSQRKISTCYDIAGAKLSMLQRQTPRMRPVHCRKAMCSMSHSAVSRISCSETARSNRRPITTVYNQYR